MPNGLFDLGAEVNAEDSRGFTALAVASKYGHDLVIKVLLEAGADPKRFDFFLLLLRNKKE